MMTISIRHLRSYVIFIILFVTHNGFAQKFDGIGFGITKSDLERVIPSDYVNVKTQNIYCLKWKNLINYYEVYFDEAFRATGFKVERQVNRHYYNPQEYIENDITQLLRMLGEPIFASNEIVEWDNSIATAKYSVSLKGDSSSNYVYITAICNYKNNRNQAPSNRPESEYQSSGSGIILTTNGIIITNYHVVENAQKIDVFLQRNNEVKKYKAKVLISDKQNDLTLLKVDDATFTNFPALPYAVKTSILDVGTSVFALGYPMSNTLGEELKVTDGIISSKTGYQGDIVTYQISAPIQPGNSGGPLFDKQGYLVGITNAGVPDAQNVGYAIKASYLRNLVDVSPVPFTLPSNNTISGLSFTEKIKKISPYVVLIKVK